MAFSKVNIIDHAMAQHKLALMRSRHTPRADLRRLMWELGYLLGDVATQDMSGETRDIETPIGFGEGLRIDTNRFVVVPILRAGLVMADGFLDLIPGAACGHIGLLRNVAEGSVTNYLTSVPSVPDGYWFLIDPIIATGRTMRTAVQILRGLGVPPNRVRVISLIVTAQGLDHLFDEVLNAEVRVFALAIDPDVNARGYVVPGLGDCGDRLFGTEKEPPPDETTSEPTHGNGTGPHAAPSPAPTTERRPKTR